MNPSSYHLPFISLGFALFAVLFGCGAAPGESANSAAKHPAAEGSLPLDAIKQAKVYDAAGKEHICSPPESTCAQPAPDREFSDKCALGGYRMMQCGCSSLCTGNVNGSEKQYYDAEGKPHTCEPEKPDCSPEPAKASFQDACNDKGFQLKICGCAWMCSNNFMR